MHTKSDIIFFGGSFNPIHFGHIEIAKIVSKKMNLPVEFVISYQALLKKEYQIDSQHRIKMAEILLNKTPFTLNKNCILNKIIYTIDFIESVENQYQNIYWIIGDDQLEQLHQWKDIKKLNEKVKWIIVRRNHNVIKTNINHILIDMPLLPQSSSAIRKGNFDYTSEEVIDYINRNNLYLDEILLAHMGEYRYRHSKNVANMCSYLAKKFSYDPKVAYRCGMLHDICKEMSNQKLKEYMEKYFPDLLHYHPLVWHSFVGSIYVKEKLKEKNVDVLFGIYAHTVYNQIYQEEGMHKLATLIYISDKMEIGRKNRDKSILNMMEIDYQQAFKMLCCLYEK